MWASGLSGNLSFRCTSTRASQSRCAALMTTSYDAKLSDITYLCNVPENQWNFQLRGHQMLTEFLE